MSAAFFVLFFACILALVAYSSLRARYDRLQKEQFIRSYIFPASLLSTLSKHHPHLREKDHFLVARALREFFLVRARAGQHFIGMPSRIVDDLWHEFILHTKDYARFCNLAFGDFFHHIPASATPKGAELDAALRITWHYACQEENINPNKAPRLPLLFAIDAKLTIAGGFHYNTRQMAAIKSDSGSCGGTACGGGDSSSCGDSGGDGGCGGGCGGD